MIVIPNQKSNIGFIFIYLSVLTFCPYCDFIKTAKFSKKDTNLFFLELENQLNYFIENLKEYYQQNITVYFGGNSRIIRGFSIYKIFRYFK